MQSYQSAFTECWYINNIVTMKLCFIYNGIKMRN